jgi:hypothetical protein
MTDMRKKFTQALEQLQLDHKLTKLHVLYARSAKARNMLAYQIIRSNRKIY